MKKISAFLLFSTFIFSLLSASPFIMGKVSALGVVSTFTPNWNDVAILGDNSALDAPYSHFKISAASRVKITIIGACDDITGGYAGLRASIGDRSKQSGPNGGGADCTNGGHDLVFDDYNLSNDDTLTVQKINGQGHQRFKVSVEGDQAFVTNLNSPSPYSDDTPDSLFDSNGVGVWLNNGDKFTFTTPCNLDEGRPVYLKWKDADEGEFNQDYSLKVKLYEKDPNGNITREVTKDGNLGGQGAARSAPYRLQAGYIYDWVWSGVDSGNAVSFVLPFNNQGANFKGCEKPAQGAMSISCEKISGYAVDPNVPNRALKYQIWINGQKTPFEGTANKDNWKPGHSFLHDGNDYKQLMDQLYPTNRSRDFVLKIEDFNAFGVATGFRDIKVSKTQGPCTPPPDCDANPSSCPASTGHCVTTTVRNDGYNNSSGYLSRSWVYINGNQDYFEIVGFGGTTPKKTFNYIPDRDPQNAWFPSKRGTVRVIIVLQELRPDGTGGSSWQTISTSDSHDNYVCFQARCTIDDIDFHWDDGPANSFKSGEPRGLDITATMYDTTGPEGFPYLPRTMYGFPLSLSSTSQGNVKPISMGGGISHGGSRSITFNFQISGGARPYDIVLYPVYMGWTQIGNPCTHRLNIYEKFTVDGVRANASLSPDEENPTSFRYSTELCAHASVPVTLTQNSRAYGPGFSLANSGGTYRCPPVIWSGSRAVSGVNAGDRYCTSINVSPTSGWVGPAGNTVETSGTAQASQCAQVHDEPYLHAFGNDVSAGGGFGSNCTNANGGIRTFMTPNTAGTRPVGSGVQIGALSIGPVYGFSSAILRSSSPTGSRGLTFSNTVNGSGSSGSAPAMGGNLGGSHCVKNYFADKSSSLTPDPATNASGGAASSEVKYYRPTGGTLRLTGGTIANGAKKIIYVEGNVVINGNITFQNTNWANKASIPALRIITSGGNVYINSGVSRLDGLYVSQPSNGNGGDIYTCASDTTPIPVSQLYSRCRTQLVVNGSFVSQRAFLDRTFSSRRHSARGERLGSGVKSCSNNGLTTTVADCAAEIFNFSPEMYLFELPEDQPPTVGPSTGRYDFITSLSPVL